jgi:hypothetical protein
MMPKLGFKKTKFKWNPISLMDEKSIIEIANYMKTIGIDGESIIKYLRTKGIQISQDAYVEQLLPNVPGGQDETAISRQRQNKKTDTMSVNLNKKGISSAGTDKLEKAKQAQTRSLNEYPYLYEVEHNAI